MRYDRAHGRLPRAALAPETRWEAVRLPAP